MSHAVRKGWHQFRSGLETRPAIQTSLNPARDTDISGLQYYYRGGLATAFGNRYRFDNQGVVLHYVNGRYGYVYYPTVIFNHAAALLRRHLAEPDRQEPLQEFLANMDWAVGNQDCSERYRGAWLYQVSRLSAYVFSPPWVNASTQGIGISLLLRAWAITGDDRYRRAAEAAFLTYQRDTDRGGTALRLDGERLFYETYPTKPPSCNLNGFIRALLGLRDLSILNGNRAAGNLWRAGLETVKAILPRYDAGFWSRYDLRGFHIAAKSYHDLLINNLELLTELTDDPTFAKQAARFRGYVQSKTCYYAAFGCKVIWRVARPALFA